MINIYTQSWRPLYNLSLLEVERLCSSTTATPPCVTIFNQLCKEITRERETRRADTVQSSEWLGVKPGDDWSVLNVWIRRKRTWASLRKRLTLGLFEHRPAEGGRRRPPPPAAPINARVLRPLPFGSKSRLWLSLCRRALKQKNAHQHVSSRSHKSAAFPLLTEEQIKTFNEKLEAGRWVGRTGEDDRGGAMKWFCGWRRRDGRALVPLKPATGEKTWSRARGDAPQTQTQNSTWASSGVVVASRTSSDGSPVLYKELNTWNETVWEQPQTLKTLLWGRRRAVQRGRKINTKKKKAEYRFRFGSLRLQKSWGGGS